MLKCNAFHICVVAVTDAAAVHVGFFFFLFWWERERARDRFPFRPSLPFAFWRIRCLGWCDALHMYTYIQSMVCNRTRNKISTIRTKSLTAHSFYVQLNKQPPHQWNADARIEMCTPHVNVCVLRYMRTIKCNSTYFLLC